MEMLINPPKSIRMRHTDPNSTISVAMGPPDATGGVQIPFTHIEQAQALGWLHAPNDDGWPEDQANRVVEPVEVVTEMSPPEAETTEPPKPPPEAATTRRRPTR